MSEPGPPAQFEMRRKDGFACAVRSLGKGVLTYHRLIVEGEEHLPCQGPALLLPKHRAYRDILVEGVLLYKITRRYATYVMKVGLYRLLELSGGVKIVRPKDLRRLKNRQERKAKIRWAREHNQGTLDYLDWLYREGELVVSHPEGMRYRHTMGHLQKEIVEHMLHTEQRHGLKIPIIPIGLEYESYKRPLSRIYFRVGEPFFSDVIGDVNKIMDEVEKRIRVLSGIDRG